MLILEIIESVVMMGVAITGAVVAVLGLRTWRHQIKGTAEYELARRLLRAAYRLREEFQRVRGRMMTGGEIAKAYEVAGLDPEAVQRQDEVVYEYRWRFLQEALNDLNLESIEAEVLWGPDADSLVAPLRQAAGKLWAALNEYIAFPEEDEADRERLVELRRLIHGSDKEDPIADLITEAIEGLEEFARPHLNMRTDAISL